MNSMEYTTHMNTRTSVARAMRKIGLGSVVDSTALRRTLGLPVYERLENHAQKTDYHNTQAALTVVVPAYNVAGYLANCLDSILSQSYSNIDVLVVDDGSTDNTATIADRYASKHKRVRVIHQPNAGLGAARNTGIDNSTSEFITFVDSDDLVPPGTYERAMTSLASTGSDVCIASVSRFDSRNKWLPFWVHLAHDEDRLAITGNEFPPIMWDVFAWNKVYRRNTWDRLVGHFPENTLYEDQECTAKLYVGGAKLDVLKEVGYNWRLRDDNTSITQQKTSISDLHQRLNVILQVREIIDDSDSEYKDYWFAKTLGEDLYYYIREVPRASQDFYQLLSDTTKTLWNEASETALGNIDPIQRLLTYTTVHCSRDKLERLLVHLERTRNAYRGYIDEGGLQFDVKDADGTRFEVPQHLRGVSPDSLQPKVEITSYHAADDGDVTLRGYGFLPYFDVDYGYSADLFDQDSGEVVATLEITAETGSVRPDLSDFYQSYENRRFVLRIPNQIVDDLANRSGSTQSEQMQLRIHLHIRELIWTDNQVKRDIHSSAGYLGASFITQRGARLAFQGDPRQKTQVVALRPTVIADSISLEQNQLSVTFDSTNAQIAANLASAGQSTEYFLTVSAAGSELCRADFLLQDGASHATIAIPSGIFNSSRCVNQLQIQVVDLTGKRWALAIDRSRATRSRDRDLSIGITGYGFAVLDRPLQAATADTVTLRDGGSRLVVNGTFTLDPSVARTVAPTFALVGAKRVVHAIVTTANHADRTFEVEFPLTVLDRNGRESALDSDRYVLQLLLASGKQHPASSWVKANFALEDQLPEQLLSPLHSVAINTIGSSRSVRIDLKEPLDRRRELGRFNEAKNSAVFQCPTSALSRSTVLFESFSGTAVSDSPLALDREIADKYPNIDRLWTVRHPLTPVPAGAVPVIFGSSEWYRALSTSKVLINNNNFPHFFRKRSDQYYVQTWHGTPLKRIGKDVPPKNLSLSYRELMKREASDYWDLLIAQSPWAAGTLRDAFDFGGRVLDFGYPRNDVLADQAQLISLREASRQRLGLNPGQRAVLYAPTWRDNMKERSGHYSSVDFLNVNNTANSLDGDTMILYRGHSNSLNALSMKFKGSVIDVSRHPDVNELIAASDLLITDYSSIMFDYVVTGKPIVFLCPDLDEYRDSVRGFYFDFESSAPGPIFKSSNSVVDFLRSGTEFSVDTTERYINFRETYAGTDDGKASSRVVRAFSTVLDD